MNTKMSRVTHKHFLRSRKPFFIDKVTGKKVLHIGACDWPYTQDRFTSGQLLYQNIDEVAYEQLGIDMDKKSIAFLNDQAFKNSTILELDMNTLEKIDFKPEIIVFGETLEHLKNLSIALGSIRSVMSQDTELLISVPNAFYIRNFVYALFGKEWQHEDHKIAFTYKTLQQLLISENFSIKEVRFSFSMNQQSLNWKGRLSMLLFVPIARLFPMLAANIIVLAGK